MTTDNHACNIPFEYENKSFVSCCDLRRDDIENGHSWCPIDEDAQNYKNVGICKDSCLKSMYFFNLHI